MNIILYNLKTARRLKEPSLFAYGGFLRRTLPALVILLVWFVLAAGWGFGVNEAYADIVDVRVSTGNDDAEEDDDGDIDLTSSDLELIRESSNQQVGMRFQNITIEQGAIINSAHVEFACDEAWPTEVTSLTFYGQAHNNAPTFSSNNHDISHRVKTNASVGWTITDKWDTVHEFHQTPDLAPIIQEIVDRSGWNTGNSLVIIVTGSGKRVAESYNGGGGTYAARLVIDYTGGSDKVATCRIYYHDNNQAQADSATSLSVDAPTVSEGDLMIATVAFGNGDATLSAPGDWTPIQPTSPGAEAMRTSAWYKVAGPAESGPYVFSADGSADEMLVDIASFYSSVGAAVLAWDLNDSSYNYMGVADTVINSERVNCVDDGLLYFAGSYEDAADVASRPTGMTILAEQKKTSGAQLLSLATYYQMRDAGNNIVKTIEWTPPAAFIAAVSGVFSCLASAEFKIDASAGPNGTISPTGSIPVPDGGSKTFAIIPDPGYTVSDVVVDGSSKGPATSWTFDNIKADHTIAASFAATGLFTIATTPGSNGSIWPAGPVSVAPGADQTFSIIPDAGYAVDEVKVDGKKKGALTAYTFENVDEDHTISATFKVDVAAPPDDTCFDISDIPLDARFESAPPNILIALDDSGSMSFEILVPGAYDGRYVDHFDYVFDNPCGDKFGSTPGCHEYDRDSILKRGENRRHWKTQWAGFNKVYYDPTIDYDPWPLVTGRMDIADANNPRSHPIYASPTFDLSSSYDEFSVAQGEVIVDNDDPTVFSVTGPWEFYTDAQAYGDGGYYSAIQEHEDYTATWAPYLLGGDYEVWVWYVAADWRDDKVPYTITHAGGTDTKEVDQRDHGGEWIKLGDYTFNTGKADVTITHRVDDNDHERACADAVKFVPKGSYSLDIDIPRAHYYVKSQKDDKPYLVMVDGGSITYFEVNDVDGDDVVDPGELLPAVSPPADVVTGRSYVEERQNFANWFTYYRRRGLAATYATAEVIVNMQAVRIGLYGINIGKSWSKTQTVLNVKNDGEDYTETLLNLLYDFKFQGGTPLRRAMDSGGRYFDKHDNKKLDGSPGDDSPWDTAENGGECQQAFLIVMTDGYYNGNDPQTGAIANNDGDNGVPYADSYSDTLADIAMYYYERDLNTDLADSVPTNPYDDATHQHVVTYTVGFGVVGFNDPADYDDDLKHKTTGNYIEWVDPGKADSTPEKIDDLWHAAVNGRGQFLNSSNPKELVTAMNAVMKDIERRVFSASGVAINGDELYQKLQPDLLMFQASYSTEGWTGEVKAFKVDEFSGAVDTLNPEWSASHMLDSKDWDSRLIASHDGSAGIPFRYGSLTDAQKTLLDPDWSTDDTNARNIMDYLHGDTGKEERNGGDLRTRFSVLGDIVHSAPVFKNDILYAGGNDGMLHAFDVATGEELFAYVPNLVFENLSALADPYYQHKYYVDLAPTIEDVTLSGISTMLVCGLGKGGRGYFALDLTGLSPALADRPASEIALDDRVMWEYPDTATPSAEVNDLGYSFSKVALVRSNSSAYPWVIIFGNGYNSASGHAVLFILDPATGDLIKQIDTAVGDCNGLSTPIAIDVDYDDTVDYVYAGDLKGNLWKFDLSEPDYNLWGVAYSDGVSPKPLFKAPNQPITTKPSVMYHCEKNGYIVVFGTGRYLGLDDLTDYSTQAVYGIWDYGDDADDSEYVGAFSGSLITDTYLPTTVSLLQQIVVDERTEFGLDLRTLSDGHPNWKTTTDNGGGCGDNDGTADCDPNYTGTQPDPVRNAGWYLNLPTSGERVISDVRIRAGRLNVVSFVSEGSQCGLSGHSWVMVMDPCTGGRLSEANFDANGDGVIDSNDLINIGTVEDPIMVPPTGIKIEGKVELPSYLINGAVEKGYYNTSDTEIKALLQKAPRLGMTYWRVLR
jgi:Tfp pilus tip-associated adhesin PilY1